MSGLNTGDQVAKTIKLFIGGKFPRTESGRSFEMKNNNGDIYAHICRASRKDLRNSVLAANKAQPGWQAKTAYNRSQILYRMAEMMQARTTELVDVMTSTMDMKGKDAEKSVRTAIDGLVYYAGFADKYQTLLGTINPVAGPHHNFTTPEAVGSVGFLSSEDFELGEWISQLSAILCSGNTVVALLPTKTSALLAPLAEILATSDLPGGVVNLLTGHFDELFSHFATHMELQSISFQREDSEKLGELQKAASETMKRVVTKSPRSQSLENLLNFVEYKTIWHPIGF